MGGTGSKVGSNRIEPSSISSEKSISRPATLSQTSVDKTGTEKCIIAASTSVPNLTHHSTDSSGKQTTDGDDEKPVSRTEHPDPPVTAAAPAIHESLRVRGSSGHRKNLSDCGVKKSQPSFIIEPLSQGLQSCKISEETEQQQQQQQPPSPTRRLSILSSASSDRRNSRCFKLIDDLIEKLLDPDLFSISSMQLTKYIKPHDVQQICRMASEIFLEQPSLLYLDAPINIVGDIHGQYSDLLRVFHKCGFPGDSNFLFLGDYVDRGKRSIETILLLLLFKIKYPDNFFLLRGNHECASINRVYGFYDECKRKYNLKIWKTFTDTFNCLPVAAIVADKIFCVHGGLSPSLQDMRQIIMLRRPIDVPDHGLLNDLLWSDPSEDAVDWEENERGVSYKFGKAIVHRFLKKHNLDLVCRAHMVVEDGYEFFADRALVTVFSAPNYCGEFSNKGAVLKVDKNLLCSFAFLEYP